MTRDAAARWVVAAEALPVSRAALVLLLVGIGYIAVADLRLSAAVLGIVALAASAAIAATWPRFALSAAFAVVLIAGTKFRTRDASATLDGALDLQIIGELALYAIVGAGVAAICWTEGLFHGAPAEAGAYRPGRAAPAKAGAYRSGRLRLQAELTRTEKIILAYAALAVLSVAWSAAPSLTLVRAAQLVTIALLAMAAVRVLGESSALWIACASVAIYVLVCASLAATLPFAAPDYESFEGDRFSWFSVHPIDAGTLAAIGALGVFAASLDSLRSLGTGRWRLLGIPALFYTAPLGAVLVLTNSRGPLLACLAGAAVLVSLQVEARTRTALVLTGGTLAGAYVAFGPDLMPWFSDLSNQDTALARLLFRGETADTLFALNGRLELWDALKGAIAAHPLVGYGYQASRAIVLDAAPWAAYAHNALLQTVLDLGLLGTIALVSVLVIAICGVVRGRQTAWTRATVAALLVFLVLNSISTESFAAAPGFETLVLFICALCATSPSRDTFEVIEL